MGRLCRRRIYQDQYRRHSVAERLRHSDGGREPLHRGTHRLGDHHVGCCPQDHHRPSGCCRAGCLLCPRGLSAGVARRVRRGHGAELHRLDSRGAEGPLGEQRVAELRQPQVARGQTGDGAEEWRLAHQLLQGERQGVLRPRLCPRQRRLAARLLRGEHQAALWQGHVACLLDDARRQRLEHQPLAHVR